jgi:hypothetical protein
MKKITILFLFSVLTITSAHAQVFSEEKSYATVGYGFGTYIGALASTIDDYDDFTTTITGPVYGKYEYAVAEKFGIGVNLAYVNYHFEWLEDGYNYVNGQSIKYRSSIEYTSFSALIRGNWHFGKNEKVDPYFGFGLGYRTGVFTYKSDDPYDEGNDFDLPQPFGFETTFGLRLMFGEHIGAYAEAGIAKSAIQIGLTTKF